MPNTTGTTFTGFLLEALLYGVGIYCTWYVWRTVLMLRRFLEREERRLTQPQRDAEVIERLERQSAEELVRPASR